MIHNVFPAGVEAFSSDAGMVFPGRVVLPVQTHSARVVRVDGEAADCGELDGVDGLVTARRGVAIGVRTADCLPLLMADAEGGVVGAIHCGWRGCVAGIAAEGVRVMSGAGARPERIVASFGPHICRECFEVGEEVAALFPPEAVIRRQGRVRPYVSLARAVELQLRAAGVCHIVDSGICSFENSAYYSVRRQGRALPHRTISFIRLTL